MIFKQYFLACLAHASYLVGDRSSKTAVIVDPRRDIDEYIEDARHEGLTIKHVILTHFHADFLAGHLELKARTGAEISLGARAQAEYDFTPRRDGERLELGELRLDFLETPGHTPEGLSIVIYDLTRSAEQPHAVLTGDTLFVGDVGRPDLLASVGVTADELAESLHDSLHEKLLALPDETLVYPAHGAGSMCGKQLGTENVTTIGAQRRGNYALQPMSRSDFKRLVTADQPTAPAYFSHDAVLNRKQRPTLEQSLAAALIPLSVETLLTRLNAGARLLDVRDATDFAAAHMRGSLNIGLDGKFATWAGSLLGPETPLILIAAPGRESEAATRLGRIGFDRIEGFLDGGMAALETHPELIQSSERIAVEQLAALLDAPEKPTILDVRSKNEWSSSHIDGSLNIPLPELEQRLPELPEHGSLVVHCASGYRSATAASLLQANERGPVLDLIGGIQAWKEAQRATSAS